MFTQVSEAEKYLYKLNAETLRNARIQVISRGFIWSVEVSPGKWEQYPYRVSQQIEDAQMNKLSFVSRFSSCILLNLFHLIKVEFTNEKSERCRVNFSTMEEQYQKRKRKIDRKRIDSSLPNVRKIYFYRFLYIFCCRTGIYLVAILNE